MAKPRSLALGTIEGLSKPALIEEFQRVFGARPTQRSSRRVLALMLAYQVQASAQGGLSTSVRKRLDRIAEAGDLTSSGITSAPRIKAGTRLIRTWKGQAHSVRVLERGFEYNGKHFSSLSEIARSITGTRWSGPLFFGIKSGRKASR